MVTLIIIALIGIAVFQFLTIQEKTKKLRHKTKYSAG